MKDVDRPALLFIMLISMHIMRENAVTRSDQENNVKECHC